MTIIIDTDAGHDDMLAMLMMIAHCPDDILCLTGVAGNATIDKVARNITAVQHMARHDHIPMHTGSPEPLKKPLVTANCHGESGLDGLDMSNIQYNQDGLAPEKIVELAYKHKDSLVILTLGPLTNVARALEIDPTIESKIKQIVIMGGAINVPGNQNRTAEFNIFVDPDAADIVFRSPIPKVLVPLDPCNDIIIPIDTFEQLKGHRLHDNMVSLMQHFISGIELEIGVKGALVYDALAAYYLIVPDAFTLEAMDVVIETEGKHTRGMTVAEKRENATKNNNIQVATSIDADRFIEDMIRLLKFL
jgi:inosine-uridine nucleoside N-ribohydrolase